MKYFIISDIHGSKYYFEKALKQYDLFHCDKMLILGDLLYHGPRNDLPNGYDVKNLFALLNSRKDDIIAVQGNCDSEVDQLVLDFPLHKEVRMKLFNREVLLTHGHKINPDNLDHLLKKGDLVLYGHKHIHKFENIEGVYYFNPGSISLPRNNQAHSFAIFEEDTISLYDEEGTLIEKYILG